mmetsp:Transcript_14821/g.40952  ORF Transcript_14821/g.40952 Transcript_14821/m.40952 type:complete len:205 (-) Transcript_14821:17-631(-)
MSSPSARRFWNSRVLASSSSSSNSSIMGSKLLILSTRSDSVFKYCLFSFDRAEASAPSRMSSKTAIDKAEGRMFIGEGEISNSCCFMVGFHGVDDEVNAATDDDARTSPSRTADICAIIICAIIIICESKYRFVCGYCELCFLNDIFELSLIQSQQSKSCDVFAATLRTRAADKSSEDSASLGDDPLVFSSKGRFDICPGLPSR